MMQPRMQPSIAPTSSPIQKSKAFFLVAVQKAAEDKRFARGDEIGEVIELVFDGLKAHATLAGDASEVGRHLLWAGMPTA